MPNGNERAAPQGTGSGKSIAGRRDILALHFRLEFLRALKGFAMAERVSAWWLSSFPFLAFFTSLLSISSRSLWCPLTIASTFLHVWEGAALGVMLGLNRSSPDCGYGEAGTDCQVRIRCVPGAFGIRLSKK